MKDSGGGVMREGQRGRDHAHSNYLGGGGLGWAVGE